MNIGSITGKMPHEAAAELVQGMADRVRSAHREAEVEATTTDTATTEVSPSKTRSSADTVGGELRGELEEIIAVVVSDDTSQPEDLVGEVIDCVVAKREGAGMEAGQEARQEVADRMRNDPVVVSEVDSLLCDIAREMALRD